jgi:ABC-type antimicrobial peptide transport system permease subunit
MKKIKGYLTSAWYNIKSNKAYALFCVSGTTLTFIFVVIILQLASAIIGNVPPFIHTDRTIIIHDFMDSKGYWVKGLNALEIKLLLENLNYEFCAISDYQTGNVFVNNELYSTEVGFVNGDFWHVNQFDFLEGRCFSSEEADKKNQVAVIREDVSKSYYKNESAIGKTIEFQNITYKTIGVVANYSSFGSFEKGSIWVSYVFDRFVPGGIERYTLTILPHQEASVESVRYQISKLLKSHYENKNTDVVIYPENIYTVKELKIRMYGNNLLLYGIPSVLLLLLFIPALNIITLSIANINNKAQETGIRRAMGATIFSSFVQILTENLLLVILGTILGILLTKPATNIIGEYFFKNKLTGNITIISSIDLFALFIEVLPLSLELM